MSDDAPTLRDRHAERMAFTTWIRLARIYQRMHRLATTEFAGQGMSVAQFDLLAQLGIAEGISQQELADRLLVTKGNISQLVARMEQRGLIYRCQEGRSNALFLTDTGKDLFATVIPEHERRLAARFAALDPGERRQLLHLLRKLDRSLE